MGKNNYMDTDKIKGTNYMTLRETNYAAKPNVRGVKITGDSGMRSTQPTDLGFEGG